MNDLNLRRTYQLCEGDLVIAPNHNRLCTVDSLDAIPGKKSKVLRVNYKEGGYTFANELTLWRVESK